MVTLISADMLSRKKCKQYFFVVYFIVFQQIPWRTFFSVADCLGKNPNIYDASLFRTIVKESEKKMEVDTAFKEEALPEG